MELYALGLALLDPLGNYLRKHLAAQEVEHICCPDVDVASRRLDERDYCLVVVDMEAVSAPNRVTAALAASHRKIAAAVLALTDWEKGQKTEWLLNAGMDTCVPRSSLPSVIAAEATALIRAYSRLQYASTYHAEHHHFKHGDIEIDSLYRGVIVRGKPVSLNRREFDLLLYFIQNPGVVLTARQICQNALGTEFDYNNDVSSLISHLRGKIEPDPKHPVHIKTIYRVGYSFVSNFGLFCDNSRKSDGEMQGK